MLFNILRQPGRPFLNHPQFLLSEVRGICQAEELSPSSLTAPRRTDTPYWCRGGSTGQLVTSGMLHLRVKGPPPGKSRRIGGTSAESRRWWRSQTSNLVDRTVVSNWSTPTRGSEHPHSDFLLLRSWGSESLHRLSS